MSSQDEDQGTKAGLVMVAGVVVVALAVALGMAIRQSFKSAAAPVVAEVAAPAAVAVEAVETLVDLTPAGEPLVTVYFESGSATLAGESEAALAKTVEALAADAHKRVLLSGYHDSTGDPAKNAELAKERAKSVRAALVAKGVALEQVLLRKPEVTTGGDDNQAARRVEIRLVDAP